MFFECSVDLITNDFSNKDFLKKIKKDEVLLYDDDEKYELELILYYCNKIESHIEYFGDSRETYMTNEHYQDACALVII